MSLDITNNGKNYYNLDKGSGSSRKTTSWTSTPDLTTLSDSVTSQVKNLEGMIVPPKSTILQYYVLNYNVVYFYSR